MAGPPSSQSSVTDCPQPKEEAEAAAPTEADRAKRTVFAHVDFELVDKRRRQAAQDAKHASKSTESRQELLDSLKAFPAEYRSRTGTPYRVLQERMQDSRLSKCVDKPRTVSFCSGSIADPRKQWMRPANGRRVLDTQKALPEDHIESRQTPSLGLENLPQAQGGTTRGKIQSREESIRQACQSLKAMILSSVADTETMEVAQKLVEWDVVEMRRELLRVIQTLESGVPLSAQSREHDVEHDPGIRTKNGETSAKVQEAVPEVQCATCKDAVSDKMDRQHQTGIPGEFQGTKCEDMDRTLANCKEINVFTVESSLIHTQAMALCFAGLAGSYVKDGVEKPDGDAESVEDALALDVDEEYRSRVEDEAEKPASDDEPVKEAPALQAQDHPKPARKPKPAFRDREEANDFFKGVFSKEN